MANKIIHIHKAPKSHKERTLLFLLPVSIFILVLSLLFLVDKGNKQLALSNNNSNVLGVGDEIILVR